LAEISRNPGKSSDCLPPISFTIYDVLVTRLESAQPLVQIGNQVFAGSYQDTLGTSLFFTQEENPPGGHDPVFGRHVNTRVSYLAATRKKLWLKRVFLKERHAGAVDTAVIKTEADSCGAAASCDPLAASKDISSGVAE
jgi:hypothetical protein